MEWEHSRSQLTDEMSYRHKALAREADTQQRPNKGQLSSVAGPPKEIFETAGYTSGKIITESLKGRRQLFGKSE